MRTFVVFCFLIAFVIASQAQRVQEATEMDEDQLAAFDEELKLASGAEDVPEFTRDSENPAVGQFVIKSVF